MISSISVTEKSRQALWSLLLSLLCIGASASAAQDCAPSGQLIAATVTYVHDGDTVWLSNREKVRLLGLNAPEVAAHGKRGEPLGLLARDALREKLTGQKIYLEFDAQSHDHYKRRLAHLFLPDKSNITAWLLSQGYGYVVTIPPNLKYHRCYEAAEKKAREQKEGIWQHDYFIPLAAGDVKRTGFMQVQGCIQKVHHTKRSVLLHLADKFVIEMRHNDIKTYLQPVFNRINSATATICLRAKGWVYNNRRFQEKVLRIYYPNAIEFIDR